MVRRLARKLLPKWAVSTLRARGQGVRFLFRGSEHLGLRARLTVLARFEDVCNGVRCEHGEPEMFRVVNALVDLDRRGIAGDIVECGCFRGGSSCKLSIIAKYLGRTLYVFDSFAGLPDTVVYKNAEGQVPFNVGDYAADLPTYMKTLSQLGESSATSVSKGWFCDTLPGFSGRGIALLLMDVDLVSSTQDCLKNLWESVVPGGYLFSQDGHLQEVQGLLTDDEFWKKQIGVEPPMFAGLGQEKMVFARK